jgi:molybdopterin converting factor small subunit
LTVARLLLFGPAREAAGVASVTLDGRDVSEVIAAAEDRYGEEFGKVLAVSKVWLNGDTVDSHTPVDDSDEVAVIPPMSGG